MPQDKPKTIFRTTDPQRARLVCEFLNDAGIQARHFGTQHGASIGAAQHILKQRIEVPVSMAAKAKELVADFEAAFEEGPDRDSVSDDDAGHQLSRILAGGVVVCFPAAGHFYARRPWTGGLIVAGWIVMAVLAALGGPSDLTTGLLGATLPLLLVLDFIGAQIAVGAYNAGRRMKPGPQIAIGLGLVAVAIGAGVGIGFLPN